MNHKQNSRNLLGWLRIFFNFEIASIDDTEYDYTTLGFDDEDIEIDVFDKGYTVRCIHLTV